LSGAPDAPRLKLVVDSATLDALSVREGSARPRKTPSR